MLAPDCNNAAARHRYRQIQGRQGPGPSWRPGRGTSNGPHPKMWVSNHEIWQNQDRSSLICETEAGNNFSLCLSGTLPGSPKPTLYRVRRKRQDRGMRGDSYDDDSHPLDKEDANASHSLFTWGAYSWLDRHKHMLEFPPTSPFSSLERLTLSLHDY